MRTDKTRRTFLRLSLAMVIAFLGFEIAITISGSDSLAFRVWLLTTPYQRIALGMTKQDVRAQLGQPDAVVPNAHQITWYYVLKGLSPDGNRVITPSVSLVYFGVDRRVTEVRPDGLRRNAADVDFVRAGMTQAEVVRRLGKPYDIRQSPIAEKWTYRDWGSHCHWVQFGKAGTVVGVALSYKRLHWTGDYESVREARR